MERGKRKNLLLGRFGDDVEKMVVAVGELVFLVPNEASHFRTRLFLMALGLSATETFLPHLKES